MDVGDNVGLSKINAWLADAAAKQTAKKALAERITRRVAGELELPTISAVLDDAAAQIERALTPKLKAALSPNIGAALSPNCDLNFYSSSELGTSKIKAWLDDSAAKQKARKALAERVTSRSNSKLELPNIGAWLDEAAAQIEQALSPKSQQQFR